MGLVKCLTNNVMRYSYIPICYFPFSIQHCQTRETRFLSLHIGSSSNMCHPQC